MREIKFRAWDKTTEQMIGILKLTFLFESEKGILAEGYCDCAGGLTQDHENHKHEVFPEHLQLMQFTGIKVAFGIDVYEGDILEDGDGDYRGQVVWPDNEASFCLDDGQEFMVGLGDVSNKWQVIGNIYENPELLTN
jgi:hypothetical protein